MTNRKYYLLLLLLAACFSLLSAQEISPALLSVSGAYGNFSGTNVSWSVGELAVTTISDGNNTITQGFLQPLNSSNKVDELTEPDIGISPNPSNRFVDISLKNKALHKTRYYLTDISGHKILSGTIHHPINYRLDLSGIKPGVYFLTFSNCLNPLTTYKIIKVNEIY